MRKLIVLVFALLFLGACSSQDTEVNYEHDAVTCVYNVHRDFIGREMSRELVVCGPTNSK